jgi:hypothetical protein
LEEKELLELGFGGNGKELVRKQIFGNCVRGGNEFFLARFSAHLLRIHEIWVVKKTREGGGF